MKDEAVILDKDYFVRDVVPRLPLNECKVSVYRYLEEELGLQISYAVKEITVQKANAEDYELLDMGDYNMVVVVKSHTYLENNTLFQCTESRHRGSIPICRSGKEKTVGEFSRSSRFLPAEFLRIIYSLWK